MINAPLIFKLNSYVRSIPDKYWDFGSRSGCSSCWLGNAENITKKVYGELGLSVNIRLALCGMLVKGERLLPYVKMLHNEVSKDQVCNLIERYTKYKLRQEHKWKQYEYNIFGQAVTDKRGIYI